MKALKLEIFPVLLVIGMALIGCTSPTSSDTKPASYEVTFDSAGGSSVASQTVTSGNKVKKPNDPVNSPHNFSGWYDGTTAWDFNLAVTSNLILKGSWTSTVTVEDSVRYDSAVTYTSLGKQWTDTGYIVMSLETGTWTNFKVSKSNDTTSWLTTYPADTVYLGGTFTWAGTTLTLTVTTNNSGLTITTANVYTTSTGSWSWNSDPAMFGFGKNGYPVTNVTKTILSQHSAES